MTAELVEYAELLAERQMLLKALQPQGLDGAGLRCEADNLRVPLRCPNQAIEILSDSDGYWVACEKCAIWWKVNNL